MFAGPIGAVAGGMTGSALGLWGTLKVTTPKNMANALLALGKHERVGEAGKLSNISKTLNHLYEQAKATGIPIEGLTYGEILQRLEVSERSEQPFLLEQLPIGQQRQPVASDSSTFVPDENDPILQVYRELIEENPNAMNINQWQKKLADRVEELRQESLRK